MRSDRWQVFKHPLVSQLWIVNPPDNQSLGLQRVFISYKDALRYATEQARKNA